jgi:hypothetical protein
MDEATISNSEINRYIEEVYNALVIVNTLEQGEEL